MASLYYSIVLVGSAIVDNNVQNQTFSCNLKNSSGAAVPPTHSTGEFISLVVTTGAELPGLWVAYMLLDRIGRKRTIQFFFGACAFFCALLFVLTTFVLSPSLWMSTLVVFGARGSALGFNQSLWIFAALYYPTATRTRGVGFTTSMARIGALLAPVIVNGTEMNLVAGICVALAILSLSVTTLCLPNMHDTGGR
jgi:MFS family permease